jgi:hypothetical protein
LDSIREIEKIIKKAFIEDVKDTAEKKALRLILIYFDAYDYLHKTTHIEIIKRLYSKEEKVSLTVKANRLYLGIRTLADYRKDYCKRFAYYYNIEKSERQR